tara:strand:+ start:182 stop:331 length:150 start_codon:yes stop_codon:yes gene_type:complete
MQTTTGFLHKHIRILQQQIEELKETNRKLREKLSELDYKKANQEWVEND